MPSKVIIKGIIVEAILFLVVGIVFGYITTTSIYTPKPDFPFNTTSSGKVTFVVVTFNDSKVIKPKEVKISDYTVLSNYTEFKKIAQHSGIVILDAKTLTLFTPSNNISGYVAFNVENLGKQGDFVYSHDSQCKLTVVGNSVVAICPKLATIDKYVLFSALWSSILLFVLYRDTKENPTEEG